MSKTLNELLTQRAYLKELNMKKAYLKDYIERVKRPINVGIKYMKDHPHDKHSKKYKMSKRLQPLLIVELKETINELALLEDLIEFVKGKKFKKLKDELLEIVS